MASKFKQGDAVMQIVPAPIIGQVIGFTVEPISGERLIRVEYVNAENETHTRHFFEDNLTLFT